MKFRRIQHLRRSLDTTTTAKVAESYRRRRRLPIRRIFVLSVLTLGVAGLLMADQVRLDAEGVIAGELTSINALAPVRITRVHARCLDRVEAGQPLLDLENEVTMQSSAQELSRLKTDHARARSQIEVLTHEILAAKQLHQAQVAVRERMAATFKAQDELLRKDFVAQLAWEKARSDLLRADAEVQAANFAYETRRAEMRKSETDAALLDLRIKEYQSSPELSGRFQLVAPKRGVVTQCQARVGQMAETRDTLFQIFNPQDAFATIFIRPERIAQLPLNTEVALSVSGIDAPVRARVAGIYPENTGLPNSILRFFWQRENWLQYTPVRLELLDLTADQRDNLRDGARVSVGLWLKPDTSAALAAWDWTEKAASSIISRIDEQRKTLFAASAGTL